MDGLSMAAGPVAPVGDGPLVEAEGGDDRLDRAAVASRVMTQTNSDGSLCRR